MSQTGKDITLVNSVDGRELAKLEGAAVDEVVLRGNVSTAQGVNLVALVHRKSSQIDIWDLKKQKKLATIQRDEASDDEFIVFSSDAATVCARDGVFLSVWKTNTGKLVGKIRQRTVRFAFEHNGSTVVFVDRRKAVYLFLDPRHGGPVQQPVCPTDGRRRAI